MIRKLDLPFENQMTRTQCILGWIYLLLHVAVLPWLLALYQGFSPDPVSDSTVNLIYYVLGIVFCLTATFSFLRRSYDRLVDNLRICLLTMLLALMIDYALSGVAALLLMLVDATVKNPNNAAVMDLAVEADGTVKAIAIFLAPIVEEVLFRGVIFGSIRTRSRAWAYVASVAAFSLYHIWQYAVAYQNPAMLLYALQYIPVSIVLAWAYERSGTIWTNIFFHMGFNAMSFYALKLAENL